MLTQDQLDRRAFEKRLLRRHMPAFVAHERPDDTMVVEGWAKTNGYNHYKGRLVLPSHYPYQEPLLYVISPNPLPRYHGHGTINAAGGTARYHTCPNGPGGCVRICHSLSWDASQNCISVLTKFHMWLEAYETYLRCAGSIRKYLPKWSDTSSWT
jgi:hypothetical protein